MQMFENCILFQITMDSDISMKIINCYSNYWKGSDENEEAGKPAPLNNVPSA